MYVTLSGVNPNHESDVIATAIFTIFDEFNNHTTVALTELVLNENDSIEPVASMSINSTLEIDQHFPTIYTLYQNYPNPFNPVTTLRYDLPQDGLVNTSLFTICLEM